MVPIRFDGTSYDVQERDLHVQLSRTEIKQRLAAYFDVDPCRFDSYDVDHRPGGNLVIRPEVVNG